MNNLSNKVIILSGWIDSSIENASLPPVVYIVGNIPPQTIFKIARKYTTGVNQLIDELRKVHPLK